MREEQDQPINDRTQSALTELRQILKRHYPDAKFDLRRGIDDPESIHLVTTVDVEDTDAVLDVVIDRLLELQIEEGLPIIHVIPTRPIERVMDLRKKAEKATQLKRFQSPPMIQP